MSGVVRRPIQALFFDVGGTLLGAHPSIGAVYSEVLARFGRSLAPDRLDAAFRAAWRRADARLSPGQDRFSAAGGAVPFWRRLLDETVLDAGRGPGLSDGEFAAVREEFTRGERYRIFPDVVPALEEARARGYILGVISNWDERLPQVLERVGLAGYFTVWLVSGREGIEKPSPEIFARACARAGVEAGAAAHVGDSPLDDYQGAIGAGLRGFLIDREGRHSGPGVVPHLGAMLGLLAAEPEEAG